MNDNTIRTVIIVFLGMLLLVGAIFLMGDSFTERSPNMIHTIGQEPERPPF